MSPQAIARPRTGIMIGITHDADGTPIVREPRVLKVGIGVPQGKAIRVFQHPSGEWYVIVGAKKADQKSHRFPNRKDAETFFHATKASVPTRNFPEKLSYFTFTRPMADGSYEPDFDAIESHGPVPTELDIIFMENEPFRGSYQMWSTSELRCKGDGQHAERVISMATPAEQEMANAWAANGSKYFPIVDGCWTKGCQYAKEQNGKPSLCKPGGDLKFQLARNLRVGGCAYFHTTGFRSISQLFSCLYRFKSLTGGGDPERGYLVGIPFKMVLRPYTTKHNGQAATQYGVWLEFRADTMEALQKNMIEQGARFASGGFRFPNGAQAAGPRMIDAPAEPIDDGDDDSPISAAAMSAEFYAPVGGMEEGEDLGPSTPSQEAAAATDSKTAALADKLRKQREKPVEVSTAVPLPE